MRIGVYVCECGVNISATVDVEKVVEEAKSFPNVVVARYYKYMCSDPGQSMIKEDIKELNLNRVVVASCSPRMHEPTFRKAIQEAGLNPYFFEMANIREQCSWVHKDREKATEKAISLVSGAVGRASLLQPLQPKEIDVTPNALVIGGGIAGIEASLEIAENGFKVYLVEKEPSIGGRMAQLDKTFPTLDCSSCILTPKMVDVSRNENIELMTYSEVESIEGYVGNFKVKIRKKPRYVDAEKCIGCGQCAEVCRMRGRIPNDFDANLGKRGAIYIPFPQAVPLRYVVDAENCLLLTRGVCGKSPPCLDACSAKAIDFEQEEEEVEIEVGAIVAATGYDLFDASKEEKYGYGRAEGVITGLEFERLICASGPTMGHLTVDGEEPKTVVFIHCVGSREKEGNEYCSRVCCMYTAKQAYLVREKYPSARIVVYYTDMRAFGKGFEEFYMRVRDEGVEYRRRELDDPIQVLQENGNLLVKAQGWEDIKTDLVVLATGVVPKGDTGRMANILNISQGRDGFFLEAHPKLRPVETFTNGIFLAGCCQGPKDIPDTVAQASAAASQACILLGSDKVKIEPVFAVVDENICSGCRICLGLCPFSALEYYSEERVMKVNEALCKGCGSCSAACPSGAIAMNHFSVQQMKAQVEGILC